MNNRKVRFRRRIFIVNFKLQLVFIFYSVFISSIVVGSNLVFQSVVLPRISPDGVWQWGAITGALVVCAIIYVSIWVGMVISNKIAGPIYHLQAHMKSVNSGERPGPLKLRKGDFFTEIVPEYNDLIQRLEVLSQGKF